MSKSMYANVEEVEESAKHWERLADEAEASAIWDREIGISPPSAHHAGDEQARTFRACAMSIRLTEKTGVLHCCCLGVAQPASKCARHPSNLGRR